MQPLPKYFCNVTNVNDVRWEIRREHAIRCSDSCLCRGVNPPTKLFCHAALAKKRTNKELLAAALSGSRRRPRSRSVGWSVGPCNAPKFLAFKSAFFHLVNFGPGEKKRRREGVDSVDRVSACVWQSCNSSHKGEIVSVPPSSFLLSAVMGVGATLLQSGPVAPRPLALSVASVGRSDSDYAEL